MTATLVGLLVFAATIWIGGLITIVVVARVANRTLDPAAKVAFFRGLGRAYGVVGTVALLLGYGTGATLLYGHSWDGTLVATVAVAAALAVTLAVGVVQAQQMTRLRRRALDAPDDGALAGTVRRGAVRAGALRGSIALESFVLLGLGVVLGG